MRHLHHLKVLIATDVSARGIDISDVEFVVNYDLPEVSENYVHRIGRTGRGNSKGIAISFCSEEEKEILEEIESFLDKKIKIMNLEKDDYLDTLQLTEEKLDDWKSVISEIDEGKEIKKKLKKKRKKK